MLTLPCAVHKEMTWMGCSPAAEAATSRVEDPGRRQPLPAAAHMPSPLPETAPSPLDSCLDGICMAHQVLPSVKASLPTECIDTWSTAPAIVADAWRRCFMACIQAV